MKKHQGVHWKLYLFPVLSLGLTTVLYSNCQSEVEFNRDLHKNSSTVGQLGTSNGTGNPTTGRGNGSVEQIQKNCANTQLSQKTITVNFPDPNRSCDWNSNVQPHPKNVGQFTGDGSFQGKIEQNFDLTEVPASAVICDLEFSFDEQVFIYDDHFVLSFDDYVIASSYKMDSLLPVTESGLLHYDWSYVSNANWVQSNNRDICLGDDRGLASCSWPNTDTLGRINLDFDPRIFHEIMAAPVIRSSTHNFQWVTIGDNDDKDRNGQAKDCRHSDIKFDLRVSYYE